MKVVHERPPIWDKAVAVFGQLPNEVIFAWGNVIFCPGGGDVSPSLRAHEAVHGVRQNGDPQGWWDRYLADPDFRLAEEIPAHRAEFRRAIRNLSATEQHKVLARIANRLASPLYGGLVDYAGARSAILSIGAA